MFSLCIRILLVIYCTENFAFAISPYLLSPQERPPGYDDPTTPKPRTTRQNPTMKKLTGEEKWHRHVYHTQITW
ncbi:unnamed protein product [Schistosoma turkestanicum]|nr:unnamed protein product [Schistosoma turkestanicum]